MSGASASSVGRPRRRRQAWPRPAGGWYVLSPMAMLKDVGAVLLLLAVLVGLLVVGLILSALGGA